jgi:hypothetical protein
MLTVFWSIMGRTVDKWLPEHDTFNSTYFCEDINARLTSVVFPDQVTWRRQRVYLCVDNARPHNSKSQSNASTTASSKGCLIHHIHRILHRVIFILLEL